MESQKTSEPVKRATASPIGCRPLRGLKFFLHSRSWGLRPRLYAVTCFAGLGRAQVDQPALEGGGYGLGAIGHAELAENIIDVTLDRRFANRQARAYFLIALASHDQFEHFHLSARQIRARHSLRQSHGDRGGNVPRAGMHASYRRLEFFEEHIL